MAENRSPYQHIKIPFYTVELAATFIVLAEDGEKK
jgi:hypothetical protein